MRKKILPLLVLLCAFAVCAQGIYCPGGGENRTDPSTIRDPELEKDSIFAQPGSCALYFKLRKAYVAAIKRCEEIIAGNPTFAGMGKIIFIAGESSLRLADNKGKQSSQADPRTATR